MLYYSFKDYEGFKELFGIEKRDNGVSIRKNKILLGHIKNRKLLHECIRHNDFRLLHIRDMIQLQNDLFNEIRWQSGSCIHLPHTVKLMDWTFRSAVYKTDDAHGICVDGDTGSIRYVNAERNMVFKMKAAKFMRAIMLETAFGKILSPSVINWLCGDIFTQMWKAYSCKHVDELSLHVDDDFEAIYSSCRLDGNFHSCMTNKGFHDFYENSVSAKAAYLTNNEGKIVVRAVIFTDVKDEDGNTWRLCERQYAKNENEVLKRVLVEKLIQGGYIDGYKTIGASCHDSRAFVAVDGSSLSSKKFSITCTLGECDHVSYQDSFKWYDIGDNEAYNYQIYYEAVELDTTDGFIEGNAYDEYHDRYCAETVTCYRNGYPIEVDENDLDDFYFIPSEGYYYHEDDVVMCDYCEEYNLRCNTYSSEITGGDYCCLECMEEDEISYKETHWHLSEYEDKYYEYASDLSEIHVFDPATGTYEVQTIGTELLDSMIASGEVLEYDLECYDDWDKEAGRPYESTTIKLQDYDEYKIFKEAL